MSCFQIFWYSKWPYDGGFLLLNPVSLVAWIVAAGPRSVAAGLRPSGGLLQQPPTALCCSRYRLLLLLLLQSGATSWSLLVLLLLVLLPGWASSDRKNGWNAFPQVNPFSEPQTSQGALIPLVDFFTIIFLVQSNEKCSRFLTV